MNPRPLLLALSVGLAGAGACVLDRAGLSASSNSTGAGGSSSVTSGASTSGSGVITDGASSAGNGGAGGTTATAQSSSGVGGTGSASSSNSSAAASSSSSAASSSASTGGGTTCNAQYGPAPGYTLCAEKPTSCEFNVNLNQSTSCGAVCTGLGGACVATLDNGAACEYLGPVQDCAFTNYGNAVCVCSLGCGVGPPCPADKKCSGGLCTP